MIGRFIRSLDLAYWNLRSRLQFAIRGVAFAEGLTIKGPLGLSAQGRIVIGKNVTIINDSKYNRAGVNHPTQLVAAADAILKIGDHVGLSGNSIYCTESITIGNHVLLGANACVYDTDFHPLNYQDRRQSARPKSAPVVIEDDVWVGANAVILKGVTIGARSIIGAGSLVTKDVPPDSLFAGTPAKFIRELTENEK